MRILITGGAGFIGSHLVEHYQHKADVIVLDNFRSGHRHHLEGLRHTLVEGSVTDPTVVDEAMRSADLVFHLGAMISVEESMSKPAECVDINVNGLLNVLNAAAVYGNSPIVPKQETMRPEPKSPYAITKLDGEYYLEMFRLHAGLQSASLRFFNVFGPRQDPKSAYAAAIPIFIRKAMANEDITIFGDGEQTRDFIYVKDIVAALAYTAESTDLHGTYNVGYGKSITINRIVSEITGLTGSSSKIQFENERPGDVKHSRASVDRLIETGFIPSHTLEGGIALTLDSYKNPVR
jgi:UDP-glucose 4-epimerase